MFMAPDTTDAVLPGAEVPLTAQWAFRPEEAVIAIEVLGHSIPIGEKVISNRNTLPTDVFLAGKVDCSSTPCCCFPGPRVSEVPGG